MKGSEFKSAKNSNETTWKIIISYDGARYKGWQRLGKNAEANTIQGKLESVMATLCEKEVLVTGSGRTDAGVHAMAQAAHFRTEANLTSAQILGHSAKYLPEDIAVISAEKADNRFHARYKVKEKHYLYCIDTGLWPDPFQRKYAWHIHEPLDLQAMKEAADYLKGEHDFSAFTTRRSKTKTSVRNLFSIDFDTKHQPFLRIRISADGFLHNMVRIIVGTLVETGLGQRAPGQMPQVLNGKDRKAAGLTAPAKGLFLEKVVY